MPQAAAYQDLAAALGRVIPAKRLITDPLRLLAYGTDAGFYRLIPKLTVFIENEAEAQALTAECAARKLPLTFRAAGTSLSGQSVTDSVLAVLGDGWGKIDILDGGALVRLGPGVVGADANAKLAPLGRKIGPDPASINAAKIGGIVSNNSSGMCCGTAQNSYNTLKSMRLMLADGTFLDTGDAVSVAAFRASHEAFLGQLDDLAAKTKENTALAARIRHKFRMKNTTGYSLNALTDFYDPIEVLQHLMIGAEGTLGFIAEVVYHTVPEQKFKASALMLFPEIESACRAVSILRAGREDGGQDGGGLVAAAELMDRASLRSVENKKGVPPVLKTLGPDAAGLLVEVRADSAEELARGTADVERRVAGIDTVEPYAFSSDPAVIAMLWGVRKGMLPLVGGMRRTGSTVIIEDVAFPVERLAEATLDLKALFDKHGYLEAIIFGHAFEGNLHFVITPDFARDEELARYRDFMDECCRMIVGKYDGALKAEHGTGRNMAPFVELEWGRDAMELMRALKRLFDPDNLLNPGVILNDDPEIHLKNIKPLPAADPLVDACMECGFCEPKCPSAGLTLSPRQRIVGWREIARLGDDPAAADLRRVYDYQGVDTCAACGLCATACPMGIETGLLTKKIRGTRRGPMARALGQTLANNYSAVTAAMRVGLSAAGTLARLTGDGAFSAIAELARKATGDATPRWLAAMPMGASPVPGVKTDKPVDFVYFPSCAARAMGPQRGAADDSALPEVMQRLAAKAGLTPYTPPGLDAHCCGMPFESKGLLDTANGMSAALEKVLFEASRGGELPVVFDTSPCAFRMQNFLNGRLKVLDLTEFLHDVVLPRLQPIKQPGPVMLHATCSTRKMGLDGKLLALAKACADEVLVPDGVGCCGFAGDKGFMTPELNQHALRHLKPAVPRGCNEGYSTSRTCEIGLSDAAGVEYRSIAYLLDRACG
jgi:D-lactate dehydrogenase